MKRIVYGLLILTLCLSACVVRASQSTDIISNGGMPQTSVRSAVGTVAVAFYGSGANSIYGCPPQATTPTPVMVSTGGTFTDHYFNPIGSLPAFFVCNILIRYYPDNETLASVAQKQYGLVSQPGAATCSGSFGSPFNGLQCQMLPQVPNTSVCLDDSTYCAAYDSYSGSVCINGGKDKIAVAYSCPSGGATLNWGATSTSVPKCSTGNSLLVYYALNDGPTWQYVLYYNNQISLNVNSCGGAMTSQPWVCGPNLPGVSACPNSALVTITAGQINKINVTPLANPTSFVTPNKLTNGSWNGLQPIFQTGVQNMGKF